MALVLVLSQAQFNSTDAKTTDYNITLYDVIITRTRNCHI